MIVKITHGDGFAGMMVYLAGPGREDEHQDPRLVAGDPALVALHGFGGLDRDGALALARDLDAQRVRSGTEVLSTRKRWDVASGGYVSEGRGRCHVWQCSLSLGPDEAALSDEKWAAVAHDFMAGMGFDDPDDPRAPARWVAVHHGPSSGGNDHVHLVANVVRADGTRVAKYRDYRHASQVAAEVERKHGLRVVEGRSGGFRSNEIGYTQGEDMEQRAQRRAAGMSGPEVRDPDALVRHEVHRKVRAAAATSSDEAEFVRRIRRSGLDAIPRFAKGGTDVVVGYSVRTSRTAQRDASRRFGGGSLAKDLSLRQLRSEHGWSSSAQSALDAAAEWRAAGRGTDPTTAQGRETRSPQEADWRAWYHRTDEVLARLSSGDTSPAVWAGAAREASGALAAWSVRDEGAHGGPLGHAARALARSAWHSEAPAQRDRGTDPRDVLGDVAVLLAAAGPRKQQRMLDAALLAQVMRLAQAVHTVHREAGRTSEAVRVEQAARADLSAVRQALPAIRSLGEYTAAVDDTPSRYGRRASAARPPRRRGYTPAPQLGLNPERVTGERERLTREKQQQQDQVRGK